MADSRLFNLRRQKLYYALAGSKAPRASNYFLLLEAGSDKHLLLEPSIDSALLLEGVTGSMALNDLAEVTDVQDGDLLYTVANYQSSKIKVENLV